MQGKLQAAGMDVSPDAVRAPAVASSKPRWRSRASTAKRRPATTTALAGIAELLGGRMEQMYEAHLSEPKRDGCLGPRSVGEDSSDPHSCRPHRRDIGIHRRLGRRRFVTVGMAVKCGPPADRCARP